MALAAHILTLPVCALPALSERAEPSSLLAGSTSAAINFATIFRERAQAVPLLPLNPSPEPANGGEVNALRKSVTDKQDLDLPGQSSADSAREFPIASTDAFPNPPRDQSRNQDRVSTINATCRQSLPQRPSGCDTTTVESSSVQPSSDAMRKIDSAPAKAGEHSEAKKKEARSSSKAVVEIPGATTATLSATQPPVSAPAFFDNPQTVSSAATPSLKPRILATSAGVMEKSAPPSQNISTATNQPEPASRTEHSQEQNQNASFPESGKRSLPEASPDSVPLQDAGIAIAKAPTKDSSASSSTRTPTPLATEKEGRQAIAATVSPAPTIEPRSVSGPPHLEAPTVTPNSATAPVPNQTSLYDKIDQGPAPVVLHSGPQHVAVGVQDPNLGWVEIKTQNVAGHLDATLVTASSHAHASLAAQLPAISDYLQQREVRIAAVAVHHNPTPASANPSGGNSGGSNTGNQNQSSSGNPQDNAQRQPILSPPLSSIARSSQVEEPASFTTVSYISVRA